MFIHCSCRGLHCPKRGEIKKCLLYICLNIVCLFIYTPTISLHLKAVSSASQRSERGTGQCGEQVVAGAGLSASKKSARKSAQHAEKQCPAMEGDV